MAAFVPSPAVRPWLWAVAGTLVLVLPAAVRLTAIPDQHPLRFPLTGDPPPAQTRAVSLQALGGTEGSELLHLPLEAPDVTRLLRFDRIGLLMATHVTSPRLVSASIRVDGSPCAFSTPAGAVLADNAPLLFVRGAGCDQVDGTALSLDVRIARGSGRVALWTVDDAADRDHLLRVAPIDGSRSVILGTGFVEPPVSRLDRAALLAHLWEVPVSALTVRGGAAAFVMLIGLGLVGLADRHRGGWRGILAGALGAGCVLGALAGLYGLCIPPLQASDEPVHILSYVELLDEEPWRAGVENLARRTHFERIRHRVDQHYRASDRDQGWPVAWTAEVAPVDVERRSPLTASWWRALHPLLAERPIVQALWRLRVANAVLLGSATALAAAMLAVLMPGARAGLAVLALFAIPTLPFYGMFWGDSPVILAASILLVAALSPLVLDSPRAWLAGGPVAMATLLVILSGRRAWPLVVATGFVILAAAWLGGTGQARRNRVAFWVGLLAVLGPGVLWTMRAGIFADAAGPIEARLPGVSAAISAILSNPWLSVLALATLPALEWLVGRAGVSRPPVPALWRHGAQIAAVALVGAAIWSGFAPLPTTNGLLVTNLAPGEYVGAVLASMAAPFRTGHFDLMLSTLFWSGFGWVDVVVPHGLLAVLGLSASIVVSGWILAAASEPEGRRAFLAVALACGLAAALAAAALGAYALRYELYGRFMIGGYLLVLLPAWATVTTLGLPWWAWLAGPIAVHAFCLQLILLRYF